VRLSASTYRKDSARGYGVDVAPMFLRAPDPEVFPAFVSQYSVTIPKELDPRPGAAGLSLPPALECAVPKRKIQYLAGRFCAREAIATIPLTFNGGILPQDSDGCPVWPHGLIGSISHTDAYATAAVARIGEATGLGVDVEPVMSPAAADEVARLVASEDEALRAAEAASLDRPQSLTLLFSAKECLFKALYPLTRRHFDYLDCEVARVDPGEGRFAISMRKPFDEAFGARVFVGSYEFTGGEVRTGVILSDSGPG
jgi:4'-phosphopantetheinyl transferase EntD